MTQQFLRGRYKGFVAEVAVCWAAERVAACEASHPPDGVIDVSDDGVCDVKYAASTRAEQNWLAAAVIKELQKQGKVL